jgi:hypothetical protein
MKLSDLYKMNLYGQDTFVSILPGSELIECIKLVAEYCRVNNTSSSLEFNGVTNRIESWVIPEQLEAIWYYGTSDVWYENQKIKQRDKKINTILDESKV